MTKDEIILEVKRLFGAEGEIDTEAEPLRLIATAWTISPNEWRPLYKWRPTKRKPNLWSKCFPTTSRSPSPKNCANGYGGSSSPMASNSLQDNSKRLPKQTVLHSADFELSTKLSTIVLW